MDEKILKRAAIDIQYEIDMFRFTANELMTLKIRPTPIHNCLVESFAIHTNNLYYFFYHGEVEKKGGKKKKRFSDDVIAEDYITERKKFRSARTPKSQLKIIEKKRHKQIAHLTYSRVFRNRKTKPWQVGKITKEMEKTIKAFLSSLSTPRKTWFK